MRFPTRAPFHRRATPAVCSALTVDDMASASRGAKCSSMNRDPLSPSGVSASSIRDMRLIAVRTQKSGSSTLSTYTSEKEGASARLRHADARANSQTREGVTALSQKSPEEIAASKRWSATLLGGMPEPSDQTSTPCSTPGSMCALRSPSLSSSAGRFRCDVEIFVSTINGLCSSVSSGRHERRRRRLF